MIKSYEDICKEKSKVTYDTEYESTSTKKVKAHLGTLESDSSGHFGKHAVEKFRGKKILDILLTKEFKTVLDVGAGKLEAVEEFLQAGKTVDVCDFSDSFYLQNSTLDISELNEFHTGDFNEIDIDRTYDAVWCSHVLEHQLNPNMFLKRLHSKVKEGGYLAIVIPPRKPFIVGGHVSMWNGGLLLYHLILSGLDCCDAQLLQYDYNIGVVVKKKTIKSFPKIKYDIGDLHLLSKYFPMDICEGFNGDVMQINI